MNRILCRAAFAVAALFVVLSSSALADIPKPKDSGATPPKRDENVLELVIEPGEPQQEAQLWLPPDFMAAAREDAGMPPAQTAATGVALSLSLAFGGVWLVRTRRRLGTRATAAAVAVFGTLAGTAVYAFANAAPPRNYRPVDAGTLRLAAPDGKALSGKVRFYYGYDQGVVKLVIPKGEKTGD
jgi:hypothetical protein